MTEQVARVQAELRAQREAQRLADQRQAEADRAQLARHYEQQRTARADP